MGGNTSRENEMDSDELGESSRQRPPLEPRRSQGGQRAAEVLYNLEQLYRSGQLRIINRPPGRRGVRASPRPRKSMRSQPFTPDTSQMDKSDFKHNTLQHCGLSPSHCRVPPYGEMDVSMLHEFRPLRNCEKVQLMHRFIPNGQTSIGSRSDEKMFCGIHSRDGTVFLASGQDQVIRVFDTAGTCHHKEPLKLIRSFEARDVGWSVLDVRLSNSGRYLAYSSWSDSVHLASVRNDATHVPVHLMPPHPNSCGVFSLMFSHDDTEILCGVNRGDIYVCSIDTGKSLRIDAHADDVNCVAFADQTSQVLYSGSDDGMIKIWDRRTLSEGRPKPCGLFVGHRHGITYLDSHADGRHLLSNGKDQVIKLWDIRMPSPTNSAEASRRAVESSRYDYRQRRREFASVNDKRIDGDTSIMSYFGPSIFNTLIRARFSPFETTASRFIYSGDADHRVFVIDALSGEHVRTLEGHRAVVRDVSWHPKRPEIISTSWDGTQRLWTYGDDTAADLESSDEEDDVDDDYI